uniref:Reverse transcriptase domain-containing protein n=1 Tax=Tanacetum cinerariifolium TaxID=118510 RepID=A0A6L2LCR3_TANCI|nr:reverse transcriptase domain-containing protein [Tanacetum cinerariifolium]
MSDSEDSTVTYTEVSSPFEDLSDIGSPGVEGPPIMPKDPYAYVVAAFQAPPSPDYVPGSKEPEQAPPLPEFVPEPIYLEFMPLEDEIIPAEEQPLPTADSPTVDSPGYIPEEDLADYPADKGDDDDDDESFDNDEDDDDNVEEDEDEDEEEKEEEEHPDPADSITPPLAHHTTTRICIPVQAPTPVWSEAEIDRLLVIPSPPSSPLSPWSSPLPQIPSPPLLVSPPLPVSSLPLPASPTYRLGYRAAMIWLSTETPSTSTPLPSSTPPSSPRFEVGESSSAPTARPTEGFRVDYGFAATLDNEIRHDPERDVGYGITNTWNEMLVGIQGHRRLMRQIEDCRITGSRPRMTDTASRGIDSAKDTRWQHCRDDEDPLEVQHIPRHRRRPKIAPKRTTRSTPATTTTTTTIVTDAQLNALIDQGFAHALAARDANKRKIKFATCTLLGSALTWWNSNVTTVGPNVAYAMTWTNLRKKTTDKYCLRGEIKKLEVELWNLKVKVLTRCELNTGIMVVVA